MHKPALSVFLLLVLAGCAQMQQQRQREALLQAEASAKAVCDAAYADPALDPIRSKVAISGADLQTFAMRINTDRATPDEKRAIAQWANALTRCRTADEPARAMLPPQVAELWRASGQNLDGLLAQLYLGRLTYGEFADKRAQNYAEVRKAQADVLRALQVQNQQAQFEAQQLANQAIANWNSAMRTQAIQQMNAQLRMPAPPPMVTCQTFGTMTTCH